MSASRAPSKTGVEKWMPRVLPAQPRWHSDPGDLWESLYKRRRTAAFRDLLQQRRPGSPVLQGIQHAGSKLRRSAEHGWRFRPQLLWLAGLHGLHLGRSEE